MRTLAIVPARAGSKGLPGKNTRAFIGKPLVAWAIECAKRTCDRVCVSTDDPKVLEIADHYGVVAIQRPSDLAQDDTPMLDVLRHVLAVESRKHPEAIVLLQPTQPLRQDEHVEKALDMLEHSRGADSVVTVVPIPAHQSPDYAVRIDGRLLQTYAVKPPTRRQDCRPAYYRDGTVYAMRTELLNRGLLYGRALPLVLSAEESVTIDTEADWKQAERMWRRHYGN